MFISDVCSQLLSRLGAFLLLQVLDQELDLTNDSISIVESCPESTLWIHCSADPGSRCQISSLRFVPGSWQGRHMVRGIKIVKSHPSTDSITDLAFDQIARTESVFTFLKFEVLRNVLDCLHHQRFVPGRLLSCRRPSLASGCAKISTCMPIML